jgi:hypothetical protein
MSSDKLITNRYNVDNAIVINMVSKDIPLTRENVGILYLTACRVPYSSSTFSNINPELKNGYTYYDNSLSNNFEENAKLNVVRRINGYTGTGATNVWVWEYIIIVPRCLNGVYYSEAKNKKNVEYLSREEQFKKSFWGDKPNIVFSNDQMDKVFQREWMLPKGWRSADPTNSKNDMFKCSSNDDFKIVENGIAEWVSKGTTGVASTVLALEKFEDKIYDYQKEAANVLVNAWKFDLSKIVYFLMKPRSGKNLTAAFAVYQYLTDNGLMKLITADILFVSLWPSTFDGFRNQTNQFREFSIFNIIDTSVEGWENRRKNDHINIYMSSMQSLGFEDDDSEMDNDDIKMLSKDFKKNLKVVNGKLDNLSNILLDVLIVDEGDHGMRTKNATDILSHFKFKNKRHELWLSGSDLYAMSSLVTSANSYIFDIIEETKYIEQGIVNRPKIEVYCNKFEDSFFDDLLTKEGISDGRESLKMRVVMTTNINKGKPFLNKDTGKWCIKNKKGKPPIEIKFKYSPVVEKLVERSFGINQKDCRHSPKYIGLKHGYWSMPSVISMYAMANLFKTKYANEEVSVGIANEFGSPSTIEETANNWIEQTNNPVNKDIFGHYTIFLAVGKMVRGATVKHWTYVMRFDDSMAWNINHQRDLRCQSGKGIFIDDEYINGVLIEGGNKAYVFDWNPLRRMVATYDLAVATKKRDNITTEARLREIIKAIPIFLQDETGKQQQIDYNAIVKVVGEYATTHSLSSEYIFNEELSDEFVNQYKTYFNNVQKNGANKTEVVTPNQESGKTLGKSIETDENDGATPDKKRDSISQLEKDRKDIKNKIKSIIKMIPLLVYLNKGNLNSINEFISDGVWTHEWAEYVGIGWEMFVELFNTNLLNSDFINDRIEQWAESFRNGKHVDLLWKLINRPELGDVSVPSDLVREILSHIPEEFWKTVKSILNPSCGRGEFETIISEFLIKHGRNPKEILWIADSNKLNLKLASERNNIDSNHCILYNDSDELFEILQRRNMKFELVIGNPPYQKSGTNQKDDNLWSLFLKNSLDKLTIDGRVAFVTPASWASIGSNSDEPGSKLLKTCFKPYDVEYIDLDIKHHFDVASTFSYYIIKNSKTENHMTTVHTSTGDFEVNINDLLCIPLNHHEQIFIDIITRFQNLQHYEWISVDPYHTQRASMKKKIADGVYSKTPEDGLWRSYHTNAQTHLYSTYKNDFHNEWKFVTSYSGTWKGEVTNNCSLTDASLCVLTKTKEEAESIQSVMTSKVITFLIKEVYKWSGYYSGTFIRSIPKLDTSKIWTNEEVLKEFFTEEEQKILQKYI